MTATETGLLTMGEVARRLGCPMWRVKRIFEQGRLPPALRIGDRRVVPVEGLEEIRAVLLSRGVELEGGRQ